jgi:AcrR family transcriptional regulator
LAAGLLRGQDGLEYGDREPPDEAERQERYRRKVAAVEDGQARGVITDAIPPRDLLLLLTALANWAVDVPQMRRILAGPEDTDRDRLRASIKEAARRLVAPG